MSEEEYEYFFIDKSGHCFDDFANKEDDTDYHKMVASLLASRQEAGHGFSVGDMLCFRDELQEDGFQWGIDFYVKKKEIKRWVF